ncbi:AfsA-related hotdog domain-containing protein [Streptomyces xiamenensis]|uniref:AfsA-related hotdog domain-containing protein n=1 Tax=Streptomyces xiamenensis TaxID=408015 RepID=UPI003429C8C6
MSTHVMVVADRFSGFAGPGVVRTVSALAADIGAGLYDTENGAPESGDADGGVRLHEGQGVGRFERAYLQAAIDRRGLAGRIRFADPGLEPVGRDIVHKRSADNVLLAGLRRTGDRTYTAGIRVHGDNELLLDHQTGEHVQGMVIVEAARQLFLGVFEHGYRDRWPLTSFYIVWNSVRLDFAGFLFPLPAQISGTVREISLERPGQQLEFALHTELSQGGRPVAAGEIGFSALPTDRIAAIERRKAARAVSGVLATVAA